MPPVTRVGQDSGTKGKAVALVVHDIARVNEVGFEAAKVDFIDQSGKFVDRDRYLMAVDMRGTRVVHGQNPKLVGKTYADAVDVKWQAIR